MTLFALFGANAYAAISTGTTPSGSPTNVVLDYDLTHVDANLRPGDTGVIQVVIKNEGSQAAENVVVTVPDVGSISVNKKWDVGHMDPYETKTVSSTMTISKDASIGLHNVQVRIGYYGYDSEGKLQNDQESVWEFPVRVYVSANFQITVGNGSFSKDLVSKLVISGTTQDGAKSVSATLVPVSNASICASVVGSSKSFVGDVASGQGFTLEYDVKPNLVGVCSFNLLLDYSDVSGNTMKETLPVSIDSERNDVDFKVIDVSYSAPSPGTESNVTVTLENVGSAEARDVSATLQLTNPFTPIGSSERFIGAVGDHEQKDASFRFLVDSKAGVKAYEIPLSIDFFDAAGAKHTLQKTIGIALDGRPELQLFLQRADALTPGNSGRVTVRLVNKGFAGVNFLSIKLLPTNDYDVTAPTDAYVGDLDSDATATQDYEITLKKNATAGTLPLKLELRYKEANSKADHVEAVDLPINVLSAGDYAAKQPTGSMSLPILISEALIALVVVYLVISIASKAIGGRTNGARSSLSEKEGA